MLFFVDAGTPAPRINESHYLTRSKHFWDAAWCAGDLFLDSREAHPVFQVSMGWMTRLFTLPMTAWLGRFCGWTLLAVGWMRMSRRLLGTQVGWSLLTAGLAVAMWDRCSMAGEWVVGGIEAKIPAYGFVFLALAELVAGRWSRCFPLLGVATAFHPLVGGWSLIACGAAWWLSPNRPAFRWIAPACLLTLGIAAWGIVPALRLDAGADLETIRQAHRVYVYRRLPHHLLAFRFDWQHVARHLGLIAVWLSLCCWLQRRMSDQDQASWREPLGPLWRLQSFVLGCIGIAVLGLVIETITHRNSYFCSEWMRFYWYRMTDSMLPVGVTFAVAWIAQTLWRSDRLPEQSRGELFVAAIIALSAISLSMTFVLNRQDRRPLADQAGRSEGLTKGERAVDQADWIAVCRWCRENTLTTDTFLTPFYNQTFKWYAERTEFVTWKDIPQDSRSLIRWLRRRNDVLRLQLHREDLPSPTEEELLSWARYRGVKFVITRNRDSMPDWRLPLRFRNLNYRVYEIPED